MKKFAAPMLAIALTASAASAGGPVVVAEEPTPVVEAAPFGLDCSGRHRSDPRLRRCLW